MKESLIGGLRRYVEKGIEPGSFLMAVLENNLIESIQKADATNLANIKEIVEYCYNEIPSDCWGSKEIVKEWIKNRRKYNERQA